MHANAVVRVDLLTTGHQRRFFPEQLAEALHWARKQAMVAAEGLGCETIRCSMTPDMAMLLSGTVRGADGEIMAVAALVRIGMELSGSSGKLLYFKAVPCRR